MSNNSEKGKNESNKSDTILNPNPNSNSNEDIINEVNEVNEVNEFKKLPNKYENYIRDKKKS